MKIENSRERAVTMDKQSRTCCTEREEGELLYTGGTVHAWKLQTAACIAESFAPGLHRLTRSRAARSCRFRSSSASRRRCVFT